MTIYDKPILTAYETAHSDGADFDLVPGEPGRNWMMTETKKHPARHCLPMLIANQSGWMIPCPATVSVKWDGGTDIRAIKFDHHGTWSPDPNLWPSSQFGRGLLTFQPPYLFRTPPGWNLLVRGPANCPKDGIQPLEAVVETDWGTATFTMQWQITRPHKWITFEKGFPICMIVPQRRGELEEFITEIRPLASDPALHQQHQRWRDEHITFKRAAAEGDWHKDYLRNRSTDGVVGPPDHQTRRHLSQFRRSP